MAMCILLSTLLRQSTLPLKLYGRQFIDDLVAAVPRVVHLLSLHPRGSESTVRFVALSSCTAILRATAVLATERGPCESYIGALLSLFEDNHASEDSIPSDIRIEAACAIASFIEVKHMPLECCADKISSYSNVLLSILGAAVSSDSLCEVALVALSQLGQIDRIGSAIGSRRSLVSTINKRMTDSSISVRGKAVAVVETVVETYHRSDEVPSLFESNLSLVARATAKAVLKEAEEKLQIGMLNVLVDLLQKQHLDSEHSHIVMATLFTLAMSSVADDVVLTSSVTFLLAESHLIHSRDNLVRVVNFTTSPFAKVRSASLALLKEATFWKPDCVGHLLASSDVLNRFSTIISHGSDSDCCAVTQICKQLLFDENAYLSFCGNVAILNSFVQLATSKHISNRGAYIVTVEILLRLLSFDVYFYFLPFSSVLLPWLVNLANRTSNDAVKESLISAIVGYSTALLN